MKQPERQTLIEYRLQQSRQTLTDARCLQAAGGSSLSVANRAYYAMFYACLALLQLLGTTPSKHSGVISLFDREFVLKGYLPKELSRCLHRAFDLRQQADYAELRAISNDEAGSVVLDAGTFLAQIEAYLKDHGQDDAGGQ